MEGAEKMAEAERVARLKAEGVEVCDLRCEECRRGVCTGAAALRLARECREDAEYGLRNPVQDAAMLVRIEARCGRIVENYQHRQTVADAGLPLWRDPSDELPDSDVTVAVLLRPEGGEEYIGAAHREDGDWWCWGRGCIMTAPVAGWCPIGEALAVLAAARRMAS